MTEFFVNAYVWTEYDDEELRLTGIFGRPAAGKDVVFLGTPHKSRRSAKLAGEKEPKRGNPPPCYRLHVRLK